MKSISLQKFLLLGFAVLPLALSGCNLPFGGITTTTTTTISTTTTTTLSNLPAATLIAQGKEALEAHEYTTARAKFTAALAVAPSNDEAKAWKAMLDLTASTVDPDIVSLMQQNLGVIGYPSTMETLFSDTWFSEQWYYPKRGFVPAVANSMNSYFYVRGNLDYSADVYNYYYDFSTAEQSYYHAGFIPSNSGNYCKQYYIDNIPAGMTKYRLAYNLADTTDPLDFLIPEIKTPSWIPSLGATRSIPDLAYLMIANILDGNPSGFNGIVDKVLSGAFGSGFDSMVASIRSIGDDAQIIIPASMITEYVGSAPDFVVVIGKPELLAIASQLELLKGLVQYIASYDLSYPLSAGQFDWSQMINGDVADADNDDVPDILESIIDNDSIPGIFVSNLLKDRSPTTRLASRNSIIHGLDDCAIAAEAIADGLAAGDYDDYIALSGGTDSTTGAELATRINQNLHYVEDISSAISGGTSFAVPSGDSEVVFYPQSLFNSAVFNLRNNIEYGASDAPVMYKIYTLSDSSERIQLSSLQAPNNSVWVGIALKMTYSGIDSVYPAFGSSVYSWYLKMYTPGDGAWDPSNYMERVYSWLTGF